MIRPAAPGSLMILIPALNEEASIGEVVRECRAVMGSTPVLVIDDCSRDSTAHVAAQAGADVMQLPHHLGLGGAVQAGYKLAFELGYEFVIRIDGDGQHDPAEIPRILAMLQGGGVQMVIGSRFSGRALDHSSLARGVGIRFFRLLLRPILGQKVHDPTSGFVGVGREALALFSKTFPLEYPEIEALVVLQRKAFRFVEVPCAMRARRGGRSSITTVKSLYYIIHVLLGVFVNILKYEGPKRRS